MGALLRYAALLILLGGCFDPAIPEGAIGCSNDFACPEGFVCAASRCYRTPPPGSCNPAGGFLRCDGTMAIFCNGRGDGPAPGMTCAFGCSAASKGCNACSPGAIGCESGKLSQCSADGQMATTMSCPSDANECTLDVCIGDAASGQCGHTAVPDGTPCASGLCSGGSCRCGDAGYPCCNGTTCNGLTCANGTCGSCGAVGQPCCSGMTCAAGRVCDSGVCRHCGGAGEPCCPNDVCAVGAICMAGTCNACGARNQPCCTVGAECGDNLSCLGGSCVCGGSGQVCCAKDPTCDPPFSCGGAGTDGICGCLPNCTGKNCGDSDGCGGTCSGTCAMQGQHCVMGQCVCDSTSCPSGCCAGNVCQPGTSAAACGSGGRQCAVCMGLALCVGQTCQL